MNHFFDKMDHLLNHFQKLLYFLKIIGTILFIREFPYIWIRFEAFLIRLDFFQFIFELSILRMRKGRFVYKMYTILYFVLDCSNSEASVVILRVGSDCSAYCSTATRFAKKIEADGHSHPSPPKNYSKGARVQC